MDRASVITLLGQDWVSLQELIKETMRSGVKLLNTTNDSILEHSGKQLRPMMSLLMAHACSGGANHDSLCFAAAAEILHNATLSQDDIADCSAERRGIPTVVSMLGPSAAVLLGDFWLARAVEVVMNAERSQKAIRHFAKTLTDLSEGEMLQMEKASSADTSEEDYFRIIYCKTASLFEAAAMTGAVSVDASDEMMEVARQYACMCGIAFQIRDDILDYAGDEALGKPVGIDLQEQKITLPLLGALKGHPDGQKIRSMVKDIHEHPEYCDQVRDFVRDNGGVQYAEDVLEDYIERAVRVLDILPQSAARDALKEIVRYNSVRNR